MVKANIHQMEERHLVKEWDHPALLKLVLCSGPQQNRSPTEKSDDAYLINSCVCKMVAFTILGSKSRTLIRVKGKQIEHHCVLGASYDIQCLNMTALHLKKKNFSDLPRTVKDD